MDFNSEHLPFQEQKLEPPSPISKSNELFEFGISPRKIFYEFSFSDTCSDWMDDYKLKLNNGSPDYLYDFWEDDSMYLNELGRADHMSPNPIDASKLENDPLPKLHHDQNAEVYAKTEKNNPQGLGKAGSRKKEKKSYKGANASALKVDEIQKHFDMPISVAAKKMNVGLTVLKKRCRELNIKRWPHRKIMSLKSLINNVKEMGLEKEVEKLECHKIIVEKMPHVELTDPIKKLRQACFKAKYKKRMQMRAAGCFPLIK